MKLKETKYSTRDFSSGWLKSGEHVERTKGLHKGEHTVNIGDKEFFSSRRLRGTQLEKGMKVAASYNGSNQGVDFYEVLGVSDLSKKYGESGPVFASVKDAMASIGNIKTLKQLEEYQDRVTVDKDYGYKFYVWVRDLEDNEEGPYLYLYEGKWARGSGAEKCSFSLLKNYEEEEEVTPDEEDCEMVFPSDEEDCEVIKGLPTKKRWKISRIEDEEVVPSDNKAALKAKMRKELEQQLNQLGPKNPEDEETERQKNFAHNAKRSLSSEENSDEDRDTDRVPDDQEDEESAKTRREQKSYLKHRHAVRATAIAKEKGEENEEVDKAALKTKMRKELEQQLAARKKGVEDEETSKGPTIKDVIDRATKKETKDNIKGDLAKLLQSKPENEERVPEQFTFKKDDYAHTRRFSNIAFKHLKRSLDPIAAKYHTNILLGFSAKFQTPYIYVRGEFNDQLEMNIEDVLHDIGIDYTNESDPDKELIKFDIRDEY